MKISNYAVRVNGLSKIYRIGQHEPYKTLRDVLAKIIHVPLHRFTSMVRRPLSDGYQQPVKDDYIWALKDVSLDIKRGEVVGIIGRNGAGKTTLLKILSRITEPTEGCAEIHGRLGSLLEVGTGFHPELTGRENIYLNGAILGMKKVEIKRKFDEIVAFAGIEKFIDTPVKRYSSGMYVRLAFAVAAHLEPEVLLVDEVLAVGDFEFQKRCVGKMESVGKEGRTVLFVSHNLPSVINICQRAILINNGRVAADGQAAEVVQKYLMTTRSDGGEVVWLNPEQAPGNEFFRLHGVHILQEGIEGSTADVDICKEVIIRILYWNLQKAARLYVGIWLKDKMGVYVLASNNATSVSLTKDPWYGHPHPCGLFQSVCRIPGNFLNEGRYSVTVIVGRISSRTEIIEQDVISFDTHDTGEMRKEYYKGWLGVVRPRLAWNTEHMGDRVEAIQG